MSLLLAYTFNEQLTNPADYSGNKLTGASNGITFVTGQNYGYAAKFATATGTNHNVNFIPNASFTSATAFNVFISFYSTSYSNNPKLVNQSGISIVLNSAGTITFSFGGASVTSASVIASGWNTVGVTWDGSHLYIFINGIQDANSTTCSTNTMNTSTVYLGAASNSDTATVLIGYIDIIKFGNAALVEADMQTLNNYPDGAYVAQTPHNFQSGDIVADVTITSIAIVTWVIDSQTFIVFPLNTIEGDYRKIGNVYNAARQSYMELNGDFDGNGNGQIRILSGISGANDYSSPASVITFDKGGISPSPTGTSNNFAITSLRI